MKKKAFTLAEVLIALGIMGIIAAVAIPIANQIKPDETKTMYLRAYNALLKKTNAIAYDSAIYPAMYQYGTAKYNTAYYPLLNMGTPKDNVMKRYLGNSAKEKKYALLMMDALGGESISGGTTGETRFRTKDGIEWSIKDSNVSGLGGSGNVNFYNEVLVDINGFGKGDDKVYGEGGYDKKPDEFRFYVYASGQVEPADPYGQMYVASRINLLRNKSEKDLISKYTAKSYNSSDEYTIKAEDLTFNKEEDSNPGGGGNDNLDPKDNELKNDRFVDPEDNPKFRGGDEPNDPPNSGTITPGNGSGGGHDKNINVNELDGNMVNDSDLYGNRDPGSRNYVGNGAIDRN